MSNNVEVTFVSNNNDVDAEVVLESDEDLYNTLFQNNIQIHSY